MRYFTAQLQCRGRRGATEVSRGLVQVGNLHEVSAGRLNALKEAAAGRSRRAWLRLRQGALLPLWLRLRLRSPLRLMRRRSKEKETVDSWKLPFTRMQEVAILERQVHQVMTLTTKGTRSLFLFDSEEGSRLRLAVDCSSAKILMLTIYLEDDSILAFVFPAHLLRACC